MAAEVISVRLSGSDKARLDELLRSREIITWAIMDALAGCDARRRLRRMVIPCKRSATPQRAHQYGQNVQVIVSRLLSQTGSSRSALVAEAVRGYLDVNLYQTNLIRERVALADQGAFASRERVKASFARWDVNIDAD